MASHQLVQLNVARLLAPLDSPVLADFVANLDRINALAEQSDGFVWRLQDEDGNATAIRPFGPELLVNLSVWRDVDALRRFVMHSDHLAIMRRSGEWFERMDEASMVLWWVPAGHRPDLDEAAERLDRLRRDGPTADAFGFRHRFGAPVTSGKVSG